MIEGSVMSWEVFENHLAPAAYFRDTLVKSHMDAYLKYNEYLVYLNHFQPVLMIYYSTWWSHDSFFAKKCSTLVE